MIKNEKIKPLSISQIIISIDRLTRFKPTKEKYLRVFKDLLSSNLIEPKFKKNEIENIDFSILVEYINKIFDNSFKALNINVKADYSINKKLLEYEKSIFNIDKETILLLDNKINYNAAAKLFEKEKDIPQNLIWLNALCKNKDIEKERSKKGFTFPLKKIILAEGITEEILLPEFAKNYNYDFSKNGILLISSGGKNQVVKYFYKFADILKLPIFVLLDNDARQNYEEIKPKLRKQDKIHILKCGEFEDTLSKFLIKRTLNNHFKNFFTVTINDLTTEYPMTKTLDNLLKSHGKEFKKAEFAHLVKENIKNTDITPELKELISEISLY